MTDEMSAILAQALTRLESGEPVEACLPRFPAQAGQLAPLLRAAAWTIEVLSTAEEPSEVALAAGRERLLAAAAAQPPVTVAQLLPRWRPMAWHRLALRPLATLALVILATVFVGGGAVIASAQSLPGDPLYPVKLTAEEVQLFLAPDPETRAEMQAEFDQIRREEARIVVASLRQVEVNFRGWLERMSDGAWTVGGLVVALDRTAQIDGEPAPGLFVAVQAVTRGDGVLHARHIRVVPPPASGATGHKRTPSPSPSATPGPGVLPTATGTATSPLDIPMPAATPSGHPTGMAVPPSATPGPDTMTPAPVDSPAPTATWRNQNGPAQGTPRPVVTTRVPAVRPTRLAKPEPTETPRPRKTAWPTRTPHPTRTPRPEPTSRPTKVAVPTKSPYPTKTPRPAPTPRPTKVAVPVPTPRPEPTPRPVQTPRPERTPHPTRHANVPEPMQRPSVASPVPPTPRH